MQSNKKITLIIFTMVSALIIVIVALVALGSRENSYEGAKKRAYLAAQTVKQSLTAHMINGNMHQSDVFLSGMSQVEGIQSLWVVRSNTVNKQFSDSKAKMPPRDEIDKYVLKNAVEKIEINETLQSAGLRITIPYIASSHDQPNCLSCHDAKEGEVLGAISLEFDIQDDRISSIVILLKIIGSSIIFLIIMLIFISKKLQPYTSSFDTMIKVLKKVHEGNYSIRAQGAKLEQDKEAFKWLNETIEKLETVLTGIEHNLTSFVHNRSTNINNDKLLSAQEIIEDISEIYTYKKTIETDLSKEDIYFRLTQVLRDRLKIQKFCIFENDLIKGNRTIVFQSEEMTPCCFVEKNVKEVCRAERTDTVVVSKNFPQLCRAAQCTGEKDYLCIPFMINDQKSVTVHIVCDDKECMQHSNYQIGIIKKYLEETKPILESRILMDILKQRSLVDGLTGLYNRKYLDDFIENSMPSEIEKGTTYAIMFLDIDYFKMVNDTYGHDAGDAILQKLSQTMKELISTKDFIIRFGGEEFVIILRDPTEESAYELAKNINEEFSKIVFNFNNESFSKTLSVGYSFVPEDTNQIWKAIKYADLSLYEAKDTGRNKVVRFKKALLKNGDKPEY
ncbi:MAG: GGDEF domain-containing protein [Arcobacteraceae bacterium]|nr:GGDEF domain-containing protein [Arcobacteraceae bacterium]